jgi:cell division septation protein DedD
MKIIQLATAASTLALGLATLITPINAQGPLYDRVYVNLPYSVTIGDKTLQPGDYVIQELESQDNSRVLLIYSDHGMKFEASAMTIPCYDPQTLDTTKIVLHHFGPDYYFDKVWIQGKNYGYEFPLPSSVKQREKERMQPVSVAARYEVAPPAAAPAPTVAQATPSPAPAAPAPTTVAQASPSPAPAPRQLPTTSADWVLMLLSGGGLSGAGLLLRRWRA